MPRKPKTDRKLVPCDTAVMEAAVLKVINGWSIRSAAKDSGICHQTLKRYVEKYRNTLPENRASLSYTPKYDVKKVFCAELENQLKEYLIKACKLHHGLTRIDVRKFAYQLAVKNELDFPDSWRTNNMAGQDWLKGFRKRHPDLSIRKPEGTSLSRATAFNETNVNEFFNNLSAVYSRFKNLKAMDVYNLDETALTTVHNPPKVLGPRGQKQIGQVTSGERGVLVTACCFINAAGQSIPPFLVFPRVFFKPHMLLGAPNGCGGSANKSGWVNGEIFTEILNHFVRYVKCTKEKPVILIMDNHESHITVNSLEFSKANGIILLTLPPHTSGKLQPLDKTVYKSLKSNYNIACNEWMISNPGRPISIYDIAGLFGRAYLKSFTPENISNGFKFTGIWPLNRHVFTQDDFLCSYVTDRPVEELAVNNNVNIQAPVIEDNDLDKSQKISALDFEQQPVEKPNEPVTTIEPPSATGTPTSSMLISPEQLKPFPRAPPRKATVIRKRKGKSKILTDTPIKQQIIEDLRSRQNKRAAPKKTQVKQVKKKSIFIFFVK